MTICLCDGTDGRLVLAAGHHDTLSRLYPSANQFDMGSVCRRQTILSTLTDEIR